jgi:hypothetical protein
MVAMENFRPGLPDTVPKALADLIRDCWSTDPNKRPNFETVLLRLDGEVHDEIYTSIEEELTQPKTGHVDSPRARDRATRGKKDIEGAIRGFRGTVEAEALHKHARGMTGVTGISKDKLPEMRSLKSKDHGLLKRASSGGNIVGSGAAPARRGMHLKKMMSVKRAPGGVGLDLNPNTSLRAAKGSLPIGRSSGTSISPGMGLPGLASQASYRAASGGSTSPAQGALDTNLILMQNKNALAKANAENESLKKALEKAKKEAEESNKRAGE